MSKYTKWRVNKKESHPWIVECETQFPNVWAEVAKVSYKPYASLISATPKLYEVCKYLAENGWNAGVTEMAREAMTKTEG